MYVIIYTYIHIHVFSVMYSDIVQCETTRYYIAEKGLNISYDMVQSQITEYIPARERERVRDIDIYIHVYTYIHIWI